MILSKQQIYLNLNLKTRDAVLRFISTEAQKQQFATDKEQIYQDFIKREKEYSTAFQEGFAIPHAKSQAVRDAKLFVVTTNEKIDWHSPDNFKVKVIFGILVPFEEAGTKHIKILSTLAGNLMDQEFQEKFLYAKNKQEIFQLLKNVEE